LFRCDDLIPEENETVQLALKRLPAKEAYDRVFRIRRAFQVRQCQHVQGQAGSQLTNLMQQSVAHQLLPKAEWTKPEEDVPYLTPLIKEIEAELNERENLDALVVQKKK